MHMRVLKVEAKYHQPVAFSEKIVKIWERRLKARTVTLSEGFGVNCPAGLQI